MPSLVTDLEYKTVLRERMRVLAHRIFAKTEAVGLLEANDPLLIERGLLRRIARLYDFRLPTRTRPVDEE